MPAPGVAVPGLSEASVIHVTNENAGLARALVAALKREGLAAKSAKTLPDDARAVILTTGLADIEAADMHWAALAHAKQLAPSFTKTGGILIVLQDTGGGFRPGEDASTGGGLSGLAKTAAHEWPSACVRVIDIDTSTEASRVIAERIVSELMQGGDTLEIGLTSDGQRLAPVLINLDAGELTRRDTQAASTWLVTGGGRGVTAACVIAQAKQQGGQFALLGRSKLVDWPDDIEPVDDVNALRGALAKAAAAKGEKPIPSKINKRASQLMASREVRTTLAAITAAGGKARYIACDITNAKDVADAVREAESIFGRIDGLIHGAGVLADKAIADKTREQFDRVFLTKTKGLEIVLDALGKRELKSIILFSSVAARFGNAGQVDYAMANEMLNRAAWSLKAARPDTHVMSLNWGPWDGGMVTPALRTHFESAGISLIPIEAGADLFASLVNGADAGIELCIGSGLIGSESGAGHGV